MPGFVLGLGDNRGTKAEWEHSTFILVRETSEKIRKRRKKKREEERKRGKEKGREGSINKLC